MRRSFVHGMFLGLGIAGLKRCYRSTGFANVCHRRVIPAQRLSLITLSQMLNALIYSVENLPNGIRILDVPEVRKLAVPNYSSR